ncbi:hypothetical protein PybrP1_012994 [[Pythium] brassicae (nom. inval.)]|nr:hypothetical protein PybrP1_012994 [[Pythium] brassicae (nom. inval.)]
MESTETSEPAGSGPAAPPNGDATGAARAPPLPPAIGLMKQQYNAQEAPPLRLVRNRSTEARARVPRELAARYRADSLPVEPRLSVYSTSGTAYESVVVVGHVVGNDGVVYYLLEVRSWEMPLEGYVVRRRYSDFKKFHQELARLMPAGAKPRASSYGGFGSYASSLLCHPLGANAASEPSPSPEPELNPLWSPTKRSSEGDDGASTRRNTRGSSGDDLELGSPELPVEAERESDAARSSFSSAATLEYSVPSAPAEPGMTYYDSNLALPLDRVKFTMSDRPVLPDLPAGGVGALLSTRRSLIKARVEQFNQILAAVMSDDSAAVATVLMNFIQEKPGGPGTAYTSLSEYAAIDLPWKLERYARRRAMSMGRRPPSLFREQSGGASAAGKAAAGAGAVAGAGALP